MTVMTSPAPCTNANCEAAGGLSSVFSKGGREGGNFEMLMSFLK